MEIKLVLTLSIVYLRFSVSPRLFFSSKEIIMNLHVKNNRKKKEPPFEKWLDRLSKQA